MMVYGGNFASELLLAGFGLLRLEDCCGSFRVGLRYYGMLSSRLMFQELSRAWFIDREVHASH